MTNTDLMSLCSAVSLARLQAISGTAAVFDLLAIIRSLDFDVRLLTVELRGLTCCRIISNRIVEKHQK